MRAIKNKQNIQRKYNKKILHLIISKYKKSSINFNEYLQPYKSLF
jgi:hypothetical protein